MSEVGSNLGQSVGRKDSAGCGAQPKGSEPHLCHSPRLPLFISCTTRSCIIDFALSHLFLISILWRAQDGAIMVTSHAWASTNKKHHDPGRQRTFRVSDLVSRFSSKVHVWASFDAFSFLQLLCRNLRSRGILAVLPQHHHAKNPSAGSLLRLFLSNICLQHLTDHRRPSLMARQAVDQEWDRITAVADARLFGPSAPARVYSKKTSDQLHVVLFSSWHGRMPPRAVLAELGHLWSEVNHLRVAEDVMSPSTTTRAASCGYTLDIRGTGRIEAWLQRHHGQRVRRCASGMRVTNIDRSKTRRTRRTESRVQHVCQCR